MARKKKQKTKIREYSITLDMGKPVTANGFSFDPKTGTVALLYNKQPLTPVKAAFESGYDRKKGLKSLIRANLNPNALYSNADRSLEDYDLILAIDTNTREFNNQQISLTAVVLGQRLNLLTPGHTAIRFGVRQCLELRNPKCKPENLGWQQVMQLIQKNPDYSNKMKIAAIVDSDLGNLNAYNERTKPILNDFYLPKNFVLIYASADVPTESIANKMIAMADSVASAMLTQIIENGDLHNLIAEDNKPFSHSRIWNMP